MSRIIELQPAYLLHSRPFSDSSLLLDFLTPDFGRISAISRGARSSKSKTKSLLQPFTPIQVSLSGKSELKTLRSVELRQGSMSLKGERLFSAMYMNEIIVRLFQGHESDPGFFAQYENALVSLAADKATEPVLRRFELALLETLGYGVDFSAEAHSHEPLEPAYWYYFQAESGFIRVHDPDLLEEGEEGGQSGSNIFTGKTLLAIHERNFTESDTRKAAKVVIRGILNAHLGANPLRSRALFRRA